MSFQTRIGETRRSTRVALTVLIGAHGISDPLTCDGETIVVNRHGALIFCTAPLRAGLEIEIYVIITDKRAKAKVVYEAVGHARVAFKTRDATITLFCSTAGS